tara:strand:+ start:1358 stop:1603 length:246 start_codon:yes stop_codon:yes gene_type:complete
MAGEEIKSSNIALMVAASAVISGGGAHLVTKDDVTSANIEDCRAFSDHAREHEQASCAIAKNKLLMECMKRKVKNNSSKGE